MGRWRPKWVRGVALLSASRRAPMGPIIVFLTMHARLRKLDRLDNLGKGDANTPPFWIDLEPLRFVVTRHDRRGGIQSTFNDLAGLISFNKLEGHSLTCG